MGLRFYLLDIFPKLFNHSTLGHYIWENVQYNMKFKQVNEANLIKNAFILMVLKRRFFYIYFYKSENTASDFWLSAGQNTHFER